MSFLELLVIKKNKLKTAETIVTCIDGRKFKETNGSTIEVHKNQYGFVVDTKPDDIPAKITSYLYLGSQDCCIDCVLKKYNITHVLSVGIEAPVMYPDIKYKYVNCLDLPETNLENSLRECIPFIEQAKNQNGNVLVHCNAGVSRSATIVIGYLILVKSYSYTDAYTIVKAARNCIKPNTGFEKQLRCLSSNKCNFLSEFF